MRALLVLLMLMPAIVFALEPDADPHFTYPKTKPDTLSRDGVSVFTIPYFDIRSDDNDPGLVELRSSFMKGDGYGIRVSMAGDHEPSALSLSYYEVDLLERRSDTTATAYALNVNLQPRTSFSLNKLPVRPYAGYLVGAGVSKFDFKGHSSNEWSLSGELGLEFGFYINRTVLFGLGGAMHIWGYPGETVGYGSYLFGELSVHF